MWANCITLDYHFLLFKLKSSREKEVVAIILHFSIAGDRLKQTEIRLTSDGLTNSQRRKSGTILSRQWRALPYFLIPTVNFLSFFLSVVVIPSSLTVDYSSTRITRITRSSMTRPRFSDRGKKA